MKAVYGLAIVALAVPLCGGCRSGEQYSAAPVYACPPYVTYPAPTAYTMADPCSPAVYSGTPTPVTPGPAATTAPQPAFNPTPAQSTVPSATIPAPRSAGVSLEPMPRTAR